MALTDAMARVRENSSPENIWNPPITRGEVINVDFSKGRRNPDREVYLDYTTNPLLANVDFSSAGPEETIYSFANRMVDKSVRGKLIILIREGTYIGPMCCNEESDLISMRNVGHLPNSTYF